MDKGGGPKDSYFKKRKFRKGASNNAASAEVINEPPKEVKTRAKRTNRKLSKESCSKREKTQPQSAKSDNIKNDSIMEPSQPASESISVEKSLFVSIDSPCSANNDGQYDQTAHEKVDWYHGLLPREDINKLLLKDGDFILRLSEPFAGQGLKPVLSVLWNGKKAHYVVYEMKGEYIIDKHKAPTVFLLIQKIFKEKKPITEASGVRLLHPIPKQDWELHHDQITLGKLLGEGAFGGVYAGEMKLNGRIYKVAVKVNKGKEANKKVIREICKEARIMRRYQHPNVVKFWGVCVEREPIMLVMEMVDHGALDSFLKARGDDISISERIRFAYGAAKGLDYLHKNGCIHRDVAARNCLVNGDEVKISDFGLSRELSNRAAKYKLKDLKQRLPIRWLAPEVLISATYSFKSDVYSFGILLWEIFNNGAFPYADLTLAEVNAQVRTGLRPEAPPIMPKFIREIMVECFAANPENRSTMTAIRLRLDEMVGQQNVQKTDSIYERSIMH